MKNQSHHKILFLWCFNCLVYQQCQRNVLIKHTNWKSIESLFLNAIIIKSKTILEWRNACLISSLPVRSFIDRKILVFRFSDALKIWIILMFWFNFEHQIYRSIRIVSHKRLIRTFEVFSSCLLSGIF